MILVLPFLFGKNFRGMAIFPFILLCNEELKDDSTIINHEKIHLRQQIEMLWLPFFILYFGEYCYHRICGKNANLAYLSISFEKEAYNNEVDLGYLRNRKFWAFTNYF